MTEWLSSDPLPQLPTSIHMLSLRTSVKGLLRQDPYLGRAAIRAVAGDVTVASAAFAICVPLRDEEALLPGMLIALDHALAQVDESGVVVFVANDTIDGSIELLRQWAKVRSHTTVVVDMSLDPIIRSAPYARRLALELGALLAPDGHLLTTDADTQVDPDWLAVNLRLLGQGADMVCGKVKLDEGDLAALPTRVHECGKLEDDYSRATVHLWSQWTRSEPATPTLQALGASLAIRAKCYRAVGGLPTPSSGEDKALARLAQAHGFAVVSSAEAHVVTSGRMEGRTTGGVSAALRERATTDNPVLDEDLVPIAVLSRRADVWNQLAESTDRAMIFRRRCESDPALTSARMRRLDVERELEIALHLLAASVEQPSHIEYETDA